MSSTSGDPEERVLSHGDVVLIRSDLDVLRGPRFINDRIIAFYFAHLSATFAAPGGDDADADADILLLPPSIPYLLSNLPDAASVAAVAEPLRLPSRRLALLPVNDNPDASVAEGGSHWTLLVLDGIGAAPRFVHHDSVRGAPNLPVARRLAGALGPLLADADSGKVPPLVEGPTPTQTNGYDCGVYVMAIAKAICGWWRDRCGGGGESGHWFEAVKKEVNATSVTALRTELLELINRLIQEKADSRLQDDKEQ